MVSTGHCNNDGDELRFGSDVKFAWGKLSNYEVACLASSIRGGRGDMHYSLMVAGIEPTPSGGWNRAPS